MYDYGLASLQLSINATELQVPILLSITTPRPSSYVAPVPAEPGCEPAAQHRAQLVLQQLHGQSWAQNPAGELAWWLPSSELGHLQGLLPTAV